MSPVPLETSGGVLSTVAMVAQRRDGPRRLRYNDKMIMVMNGATIVNSIHCTVLVLLH